MQASTQVRANVPLPGKPLAFADPLGLEPCNTASLRKDDGQHRVGGPYSGDDDGAAGSPGDCDGGVQQCSLDGVDMECNLLLEFTGLEGGLGGGESIGGIAQCAWADCMGAGAIFDSNNNIRAWQWKDKGGPGPCSIKNGAFTCESDPDWGWQPDPSHPGSQPGCGALNFGCQFFSGFVNFFLNERPSGIAQMALGEAGAGAAVLGTGALAGAAPALGRAAIQIGTGLANGLGAGISTGIGSGIAAAYATNPTLFVGLQQFAQSALAPNSAVWSPAGLAGVAGRDVLSSWNSLFAGPW